jgi:hypothetical protein
MYNQVPVEEDKDQFNSTLFNNLSVQGLISPRGTVFDRSLDQKDIERETEKQRREDVEEDGPQDQRILAKAMQLAYQMAERAGRQSDQMGLGSGGAPTVVDVPDGDGYVLVKKKSRKTAAAGGPFAKKAPARSVGSAEKRRQQQQQKNPATRWKV